MLSLTCRQPGIRFFAAIFILLIAAAATSSAAEQPRPAEDTPTLATPSRRGTVLRIRQPEPSPAAEKSPDALDAPPATSSATKATPKATTAPGRIEPHDPKPVIPDVKKLIAQAYELSRSADSEQDHTKILQLCQQAADRLPDGELATYVSRLAAWAHDHRGQAISDRAARLSGVDREADVLALERKALVDFDHAVQLDPTRWRAVHNRGVSYALQGKDHYQAALRDFDRTIELQPNFYKAWFNRAEIRRELGEYRDALTDYTEAMQLKPDNVLARRGRAHTYYQLRQHRAALADFTRVVKLDPKDTIAWVDRADLLSEMKEWKLAADDYQAALKLDPEFGRAFLGAAWLMATCPSEQFRDPQFAVRAAEKAVELDGPQDHHYLDTLAAAYASAGMYAEAKSAAGQALNMAPAAAKTAVKNRLVLYEQEQSYQQKPRKVRPAGGFGD